MGLLLFNTRPPLLLHRPSSTITMQLVLVSLCVAALAMSCLVVPVSGSPIALADPGPSTDPNTWPIALVGGAVACASSPTCTENVKDGAAAVKECQRNGT